MEKDINLRWRDEGTATWEREVNGRMKKRKQTCFLILLILFLMVRTGWGVIACGRANGVIHPTVTVQQSWNTATIRDNRRLSTERGRELSWSSALPLPKSHEDDTNTTQKLAAHDVRKKMQRKRWTNKKSMERTLSTHKKQKHILS